ncbi:MAG: hypothetical protein V4608_15910 [Bacteroidota bacterium]
MYQIRKSDLGYQFTTENNVEYSIYFTLLDHSKFPFLNKTNIENYYYFGLERLSDKFGTSDIFIKRTVVFAIVSFFLENEGAVLVFNYSNDSQKLAARRRLFLSWFKEFQTHTVYQFYQYDFSDYDTVCALYKRSGGANFDVMKNAIEESISNLSNTIK